MLFDDYNLNLVTGFSVNVKDEWFFKKKMCQKITTEMLKMVLGFSLKKI